MKEVKIDTVKGTKRVKEPDSSIKEDKPTENTILQLESQTEIVYNKIGNEEKKIESESTIQPEILSPDVELENDDQSQSKKGEEKDSKTKDGFLMKKIVLKKDVKTQDEECEDKSTKNSEIKRNNENLSKDTAFSINDYNSTMNTIKPLESQSEIVSHRIRNEMEILESGRIIQTEISSPDGNFDGHRGVEIIGGEMIQSVI